MTARERLEAYLGALHRRMRAHIYARAAAIAAAGALLITCLAVWLLARQEFAPSIVLSGRSALALLLICVAAFALWRPLRELRREDGAGIFERKLPAQNGRIRTYLDSKRREAQGVSSPLIELLAADAATIAERTAPEQIVRWRHIGAGVAAATLASVGLALLLSIGPGYWGFATRHLLFGAELPRDAVPVRRVMVTPGNATVRRNSDLAIRASVEGFHPKQAQVFVKFADRQDWERAPMQAASGARESQFEFRLYAVRAPLQYYVDAEGTKSGEHGVAVVDLPRIERMRLTYAYPEWTGLPPKVDDASRDIRAVEGTTVKVDVFADAPLEAPALIVDGQAGELARQGHLHSGTIAVTKAGRYQIGAKVADEFVALSGEYEIEIVPDEKPMVEIGKPGRDWRATSIEEVPVRVRAEDDFRLREVSLRYSVNGGEWQTTPLDRGVQQTDRESLLNLEALGAAQSPGRDQRLAPGDLISYYAVAKDRREAVESDLYMVQVQPFERRYTQAQAGTTDGAMGDEQGAISERQREILLATWNLQRSDERNARSRQQLEDSAKMLAELQTTLSRQARTLAQRTRARALVDEDERVRTFVESLERAAAMMDPVVKHLNQFELRQAIPLEQQALQQLLRAEAAFREVQVSMQQNNRAGDGSQAARNFTEMFELEMDLEKSQYESESQLSRRNTQKDLEEAIRKLKELAERQERLAQERNSQDVRTPEQRWRQEQLRREAEDLRRRLAELNRQQSSSDSDASRQDGSRQGESKAGETQQGQARGGPRGSERERQEQRNRLAQALESVNQALEDMRSANGNASGEPDQAGQRAQDAGRKLRRALQQFDEPEPSRLDEALSKFADRAQRMVDDQRRVESDLYEALAQGSDFSQRLGSRGGIDQQRVQELVRSKQQMAGDLTALQRDMRNAVHEHRAQTPGSARRLSEIIRDIEGSDVMYRLNRSAAEIYYGRAREAAPREGLITDALDTLERDLREASVQAAQEKRGRPQAVTPDDLLAEVADLRRSLQQARRRNEQASARNESSTAPQRDGSDPQNDPKSERTPNGSGTQTDRSNAGLAGWNPSAPSAAAINAEALSDSLARETAALSERIRNLTYRMRRGTLSAAELEALRRGANELRRLSGDPMAGQTDAMLELVDQIELTALAASARQSASARAAMPSPESPRYREAVAEYYRRLGSR